MKNWEFGSDKKILFLSLVFQVSGALYEASYETSFASVLFDFERDESNKTNANQISLYEAPLTRI